MLMVRANFYVHFADGVFDISIFGGWRRVQITAGKKFAVTSSLMHSLGPTKHRLLIKHLQLQTSFLVIMFQ